MGFLTINSQPAVDGARSDDKTFGWGPSNGYVYQKVVLVRYVSHFMLLTAMQAYLEFFASPSLLEALLPHIQRDGQMTYYAITMTGDLRTNSRSEGPNAVTWGVFPAKEIVQPTIVEAISFMAWKVCALPEALQ
jgi:methylenetetrahydrofolate reductase (NADPH)